MLRSLDPRKVRAVGVVVKQSLLLILLFLLFLVNIAYSIPDQPRYVVVVEVRGGIYHGTEYLIEEGINEAEKLDAPLVLLIDTPGGMLDVLEEIVKDIRNSNVPVIGYVYPMGATAWSAGTILLIATHIAAMSPGTLIGASQPVLYDPSTGTYKPINESKVINPIVGIITELARDRGRNTTAAEKFVRQNLYLDEEKALKYHVINLIAHDLDDLLNKIDGWTVKLDNGREYVLHTRYAEIIHYNGSLRTHIVALISDPLINSMMATIGVLILVFGILSGHYPVVPLGIGLIILSLLGSGFSSNLISLLLILVGGVALAIEFFTPGFGVLGITGIVLIALSIALMPILNPGYLISPAYQATLFWIGVSIGTGMGGFTGFVLYKVIKVKKQPVKIKSSLVGAIGRALDNIGREEIGFILVEGEYWRAKGIEDIKRGEKVIVVGKEGSILLVKKYVESGHK